MQISNDSPTDDGGWAKLITLQSEYQARLTEETLKYLRSLQAAFSPRAPGTVVQSSGQRLTGGGEPGGTVHLEIQVENRQRVHTPVSPAVTPLVGDDGSTWYPVARLEPVAMLIGPDETRSLSLTLELPADLPAGCFRGSLVLQGFLAEGVPIDITVRAPMAGPSAEPMTEPSAQPETAPGVAEQP